MHNNVRYHQFGQKKGQPIKIDPGKRNSRGWDEDWRPFSRSKTTVTTADNRIFKRKMKVFEKDNKSFNYRFEREKTDYQVQLEKLKAESDPVRERSKTFFVPPPFGKRTNSLREFRDNRPTTRHVSFSMERSKTDLQTSRPSRTLPLFNTSSYAVARLEPRPKSAFARLYDQHKKTNNIKKIRKQLQEEFSKPLSERYPNGADDLEIKKKGSSAKPRDKIKSITSMNSIEEEEEEKEEEEEEMLAATSSTSSFSNLPPSEGSFSTPLNINSRQKQKTTAGVYPVPRVINVYKDVKQDTLLMRLPSNQRRKGMRMDQEMEILLEHNKKAESEARAERIRELVADLKIRQETFTSKIEKFLGNTTPNYSLRRKYRTYAYK